MIWYNKRRITCYISILVNIYQIILFGCFYAYDDVLHICADNGTILPPARGFSFAYMYMTLGYYYE